MTDFVYDNTDVPDGKSDASPVSGDPNQHISASEWNTVMQAVVDLRDAVLDGNYHGLTSDPAATVSASGKVKLRNNAGVLQVSENGGDYASPGPFVNVRDFGAVGDGSTDDLAAFNAAIQSFGTPPKGGTLIIPRGTYRLSGPLNITRCMNIMGQNFADYGYGDCTLKFDAGVSGIILHRLSTSPEVGGLADWSVIENVAVAFAAKSGSTNGIELRCRAWIRNFFVSGASGHGVYVDGGSVGHNANNFRISSGRITACSGDGLFVTGSDANAGLVEMLDCTANGGRGIRDTSLTGSTYIACHVDANTGEGYYVSNSGAGGMLLNCYSEGGFTASYCGPTVLVVGGTHGAGFSTLSHKQYGAEIRGSPAVVQPSASDAFGTTTIELGKYQEPHCAFRLTNTLDVSGAGVFKSYFDEAKQCWADGYINAPANILTYGFTDDMYGGRLELPGGIHLNGPGLAAAPGPRVRGSSGEPLNAASVASASTCIRKGDFFVDSNGGAWVAIEDCGFGSPWVANLEAVYVDTMCAPATPNGYVYRCTDASTTTDGGASEPTWPVVIGNTVADGGLVWECWGPVDNTGNSIRRLQPKYADSIPDATGSPGNATQNNQRGRAAFAAAGTAVTITNSLVTTSSIIGHALQTVDGTLTQILTAVPGTGSFVVTGNAAATGTTNFAWWLVE